MSKSRASKSRAGPQAFEEYADGRPGRGIRRDGTRRETRAGAPMHRFI
jgi:hypothetical protein